MRLLLTTASLLQLSLWLFPMAATMTATTPNLAAAMSAGTTKEEVQPHGGGQPPKEEETAVTVSETSLRGRTSDPRGEQRNHSHGKNSQFDLIPLAGTANEGRRELQGVGGNGKYYFGSLSGGFSTPHITNPKKCLEQGDCSKTSQNYCATDHRLYGLLFNPYDCDDDGTELTCNARFQKETQGLELYHDLV